jgi:hypothetical protein
MESHGLRVDGDSQAYWDSQGWWGRQERSLVMVSMIFGQELS